MDIDALQTQHLQRHLLGFVLYWKLLIQIADRNLFEKLKVDGLEFLLAVGWQMAPDGEDIEDNRTSTQLADGWYCVLW